MINYAPLNELVPWCSGLTCGPVKAEIAGSNPVGTAERNLINKNLAFDGYHLGPGFYHQEIVI